MKRKEMDDETRGGEGGGGEGKGGEEREDMSVTGTSQTLTQGDYGLQQPPNPSKPN